MSFPPEINNWQLAAFVFFIILSSLASLMLKLKMEKDLWWGACRTFGQLFLLGYILEFIFAKPNFFLVMGVFVWMVFWGARIISGRLKDKPFPVQWQIFLTMFCCYIMVSGLTTGAVLQVTPWYDPRVFILLAGMVVGNSMNAIAISLDRLFSELRNRRAEVEQMLIFGAEPHQATQSIVQEAVRAGMIPSVNSMMSVGLVFIPGMMTGQVLGGQPPVDAAKYQIMIMLMISASTASGCFLITLLTRRRCFNDQAQLIV